MAWVEHVGRTEDVRNRVHLEFLAGNLKERALGRSKRRCHVKFLLREILCDWIC
jgi:hypothetical protein